MLVALARHPSQSYRVGSSAWREMRPGKCPKNADAVCMVARWIAGGLLAAVGWPAVVLAVALLQERLARWRAHR
jgi:hypothetical protein